MAPILQKITGLHFLFSLLLAALILACVPPDSFKKDPNLPNPGFRVEGNRSDLQRPARKGEQAYPGPVFDAHVHLDPPVMGIQKRPLQEMIEAMDRAGVVSMIVMPVPNEGHIAQGGGSIGAEQRRTLRRIGGEKIKLFCGSDYISNWLHQAYHAGYREGELQEVLGQLAQELDDPDCAGIGEIGLYHFNKDRHQNVIEYSPAFEPFLRIVGLIARKGAWMDLHAEPVDPDGKSYEEQVFGGLELIFQKFPNLKLIVSHTGMTHSSNARRILKRYPNVMMNFKPIKRHELWRNLEPVTNARGRLYRDWAELFEEMPERFMVGTDEKFGRVEKGGHGRQGVEPVDYGRKVQQMRKILGCLEPGAAEKIAWQNAKRIFK